MQNIFLEGIEIFNYAEEYEYLEASSNSKSIINEIFKIYKAKVGRIGKYNYNKKDIEELLRSEPELIASIEKKLYTAKNAATRAQILDQIVTQMIKIIQEDEKNIENSQMSLPSSQSRIASTEFIDKNKFTQVMIKIYRALKYINHVAEKTKQIKPIKISDIHKIDGELLEEIFDKLNLIENPEVNDIRKYMQANDLVGNNKIVWPNVTINLPEKLSQDFIDKYYQLITTQMSGEKNKEQKRLSRKTFKMHEKKQNEIAKSVGEDVEYAIHYLKNKPTYDYDENKKNIYKAIDNILKLHSQQDIKTYLMKKSQNSRYNFDIDNINDIDDIKSSLYELLATESKIIKRGRQRKS